MSSPPDPNPNPSSPTREDRARQRAARRRNKLLIWTPILLALTAGAGWFGWYYFKGVRAPFNGPTYDAKMERLQLVIVERGTLESAENSDVVCRVKAGKKGTSGVIRWVVDDGTQVDKGQKLMEIEDSALQEDLKDQINKLNNAKAARISAEANLQITKSNNFSDIEKAKTDQILAEIKLRSFLGEIIAAKVLPITTRADLQRYMQSHLEADLVKEEEQQSIKAVSEILQTLSDIVGRMEIARSDRELSLDKTAWSFRMLNMGYLTRSQAEAEKSRLGSAEFTVKKTQFEHDLFRKYTIEEKITDLWSKVKETDRALDRAKSQADSKLDNALAELDSKKAIYEQEQDRKLEIEEEIVKCLIYAPQAGLVVYSVSEQSKFGIGGQQSIIAQGESVKEGQKLMRIPNLSRMLVDTRVHEAMVSRIKGEVNRPTFFSDTLRAVLCMDRLPFAAATAQFAYNEMHSEFRDKDFETLYEGQKAFIRVDSQAGKIFKGRVKSVATVASQADWSSSDVKVYKTMVTIDETVINLKPGMSAEVTILAEESTEPVLTIPIQSVAGSIAMGAKRKVFVIENGQPREVEIVVGRSNDRLVEVKEGLEEGAKVVLNPRSLLGDKSGMKTGTPATRRGVDTDEMGGAGGGAKKWGGKKGGMPPGGPGAPPNGAAIPGSGKQYNRPDADNKKS